MSECTHTELKSGYWTKVSDWWTGELVDDWFPPERVSTCVDIDLHRYKCTQCGHIGYYSTAAREYYENGKINPYIKGLDK